MSDDRPLVETALDLLFYAPVGLALTATEELPDLVEKGRTRIEGQVATARMVGRFAVSRGGREATRLVSEAAARLAGTGTGGTGGARTDTAGRGGAGPGAAGTGTTDARPASTASTRTAATGTTGAGTRGSARPATRGSSGDAGPAKAGLDHSGRRPRGQPSGPRPRDRQRESSRAAQRTGSAGADLAIPGYDSLSASQVLPRLPGISEVELEELRRYEASNRGRKTILNRIAQIQSGGR